MAKVPYSLHFTQFFWFFYRNDLNENEKVVIVDQISQSISRNLGLREQLEIIKIINPKSSVSSKIFNISVASWDSVFRGPGISF
jgi:hypothetical protein